MKNPTPMVYLVDDEQPVLRALSRLLRSKGREVMAFESAAEFIQTHRDDKPGCAVIDLAMPELTGLQLQERLSDLGSSLPVIFLTGNGDIPSSVKAMKGGAIDFLTKPVDGDLLIQAIDRAIEAHTLMLISVAETAALERCLSTLTPREREVLEHVVAGKMNKQIAADLGIVEKTIKVHRSRIMEKMQADSLAELVRMTQKIGIEPARP